MININYIILAIPLILTIIGFVGSYIIGNDCVFIHEGGAYSGNCNGINNTLTWMKYGILIYIVMIPILIMSIPYMLGGLGLSYLFTRKNNSISKNNSNKNISRSNSNT